MRYLLLTISFFLSFAIQAQQDIQLKEYSYSELFQMIEQEEDSIFELNDALIKADPKTDQRFIFPSKILTDFYGIFALSGSETINKSKLESRDSIVIDKHLSFRNVRFESIVDVEKQKFTLVALSNIHFKKSVELINALQINITASRFDGDFRFGFTNQNEISKYSPVGIEIVLIWNNSFNKDLGISSFPQFEEGYIPNLFFTGNTVEIGSNEHSNIFTKNNIYLQMSQNTFAGDRFTINISSESFLLNNRFSFSQLSLYVKGKQYFIDNVFGTNIGLEFENVSASTSFDWKQINGKIYAGEGYDLGNSKYANNQSRTYNVDEQITDETIQVYLDSIAPVYKTAYNAEQKLRGALMEFYKQQNDIESRNAVYVESKNLETTRLGYLYQNDPHFNTFFKWKINQFLKLFSAYGTEPSRAIVFSVYVILAFALVYLFFPNYWDSHGKNRIKDRFLFFHKYLRHNKGIQDVYLEEQQAELQSAYAFQQVLDEHKTEVPGFFYSAAKPLYRWSVAGTTLYAKLLSRVDFLEGSWKETEPKKRKLRTALTIVVFVFALIYDVFIKVLNALMLSINTFTTLGFGEIPIKGLPRYLAIIQGFIGWFMLTIFSVSLISQLLN